jgi:hypothetical protein
MTSAALEISAVETDVNCPACGYNLRGLVVSRCPECGRIFALGALLRKETHPYLFEHCWRGLDAIILTWWHSLRPRLFWKSAGRDLPPNPWRLIGYWLAVTSMSLLLLFAPMVCLFVKECVNLGFYGVRELREIARDTDVDEAMLIGAEMILLWPAMTLLSFMFADIFDRSNRSAGDYLRVAVYSAAPLALLGPLTCGMCINAPFTWSFAWTPPDWCFDPAILFAACLWAVLIYRLMVACRIYFGDAMKLRIIAWQLAIAMVIVTVTHFATRQA